MLSCASSLIGQLETRIWTVSNDLIDRLASKWHLRIGLISFFFLDIFFFFLRISKAIARVLRLSRFQNVEHSPIRTTRDPLKPTKLYNRRRGIFFFFFLFYTSSMCTPVLFYFLTLWWQFRNYGRRARVDSPRIEKRPKMQRASKQASNSKED